MQSPIDNILDRLENVRQIGDRWMASCPTRRDTNPSLSIRVGENDKVLLHDFGGSSLDEILDALGIEATDLFANDRERTMRTKTTMDRPRAKKIYKKPVVDPAESIGPGGIAWFAKRKISAATLEHFGVFTTTHWFNILKREGPAFAFPYRSNGERVNIKFRSGEAKDFAMHEDAEPCFYNIDAVRIKNAAIRQVIIVEGEPDLFALYECGIANVISPPNGSNSITPDVMDSAADILKDNRIEIVLAGDADEAGEKMMDELAFRIGKQRCSRVHWPAGCKDANDTLIQHGKEVVIECIANAEGYAVDGIIEIHDISEDLWKMYTGGMPRGISTGIPSIDNIYTIMPGQMTTITGSPNIGKTTLIDNFIVNAGNESDINTAICSLENRRAVRHAISLATKIVGKPFRDGFTERMTPEDVDTSENWMKKHVSFVHPEDATVDAILYAAQALVYRKGVKMLVIDPWNRIHHPQSMSNGDYVAEALTKMGEFADRFDVHVFLVAHPTKLSKDANGNYPIPTPYDISGSANFANMSDYCLSLWRILTDQSRNTELHCQKSRYDEVATIGYTELGFERSIGRYYDLQAMKDAAQGLLAPGAGPWHPVTPAERMLIADEADPSEVF